MLIVSVLRRVEDPLSAAEEGGFLFKIFKQEKKVSSSLESFTGVDGVIVAELLFEIHLWKKSIIVKKAVSNRSEVVHVIQWPFTSSLRTS